MKNRDVADSVSVLIGYRKNISLGESIMKGQWKFNALCGVSCKVIYFFIFYHVLFIACLLGTQPRERY